jgi:putative DNA primase/helicase
MCNFTNRVVPVLLCNSIPSLADLSPGIQRRLMVMPFDRQFGPKEEDRNRFTKIWAEELPGILNQSLSGLDRVVNRQFRFKYPKSVVRATSGFLRDANPLPAFLAERCERDPAAKCRVRDMYENYCNWAKGTGITLVQQRRHFTQHIRHLRYKVTHGNDGDYVIGIRLKNAFERD